MVLFDVHPVPPQGTNEVSSGNSAIVVIPARYRSSRLPGKPLADIAGRPMVEHVYRRAEAATSVNAVLVATDDTRIRDAVIAFGGEALMTASEHQSGTERLAEATRDLRFDLVVNLQADEPLVEPTAIDLTLGVLIKNPKVSMATVRYPITDPEELVDPNVVKVVVDSQGFALYFSRNAIPHQRDAAKSHEPVNYRHVGLYAYRREFLTHLAALEPTPLEKAEQLEQLRALEHGYRIQTVEITQKPVGVDTPHDLDRVRRIISNGVY